MIFIVFLWAVMGTGLYLYDFSSNSKNGVRARQCCDDACNIALIEKNGVTPKWAATPFWSDSVAIDFNESCVTNVIAALTLR